MKTRTLLVAVFFALLAGPSSAADDSLKMFESLQKRIVQVAKEITPSVVYIEAILKQKNQKSQVSGSGIIVDKDGTVFTNEHVVENALKVTVKVFGEKEPFPAHVVGTDKQTDLAVLKFDPGKSKLVAAKLGKSKDLEVGQWVLAVGNPYGFDHSVSFGIVQAKGRNLRYRDLINEFIQTDALIDQGSSGGPLVNLRSEVVGINSIAAGRGMGFTIPIETAQEVAKNIASSGSVQRGWLGITFQPLPRQLAKFWGLGQQGGVIINSVIAESPAERAGLKAGDIVTAVDGQDVDVPEEAEATSFARLVAGLEVGKKVEVKVLRDLKPLTLTVKLDAQPAVDAADVDSDWGFFYQEITSQRQIGARLDDREGAWVSLVERGSPADEAGVEIGDVISGVGEKSIKTAGDLTKALEAAKDKPAVLLTVRRGRDIRFHLLERTPSGEAASASTP
ncbi:MAG: trypsin-like peptidase domain-containing protein [Bdellovibrionota bacterium]